MTSDKLTVNELFSGIGAQRKALERLGIPHEVVGICEIDKYAIQSYEAIFGETKNYGDICTAERLDYADLWTYSFPCQDISVAGKQQGINENTRSGLLYQVQRLLEVAKREKTLPKYLLLENVKNLVGKQFKEQFFEWIYYLSELGYDTYWQVLNAKNYGIPQNRERVFAISIRKDLNQTFEFPQTEELKIRLKDVLEDEVEEKFYLSNEKIHKIQTSNFAQERKMIQESNVCSTLLARYYKDPKCVKVREATKKGYAEATIGDSINIEHPNSQTRRGRVGRGVAQTLTTSPHQVVLEPKIQQVGNYMDTTSFGGNPQCGRVYNSEGISPTLNTMQGGDRQPKIVIGSTQKNAYIGDGEMSPTLTSAMGMGGGHVPMVGFEDIRIRKLTPLECWRLMGFDDEDFYKAQKSGVSNSQLYKQAGNSIVVNVLEKIFKNLF
jgi:DNA (cytosine-5)-methyltransferase 1